jgi:hypothetical protein
MGLIRYLYGPGKREEHLDPHIVTGWRDPAGLEPPLRAGGRWDFRRLNGLLSQPNAALGPRAPGKPVWHCAVRAAPGDRMLSDEEWGRLARDMHSTGLAPHRRDDDAVRWVAIRHAEDHIHIVGMLARQDGTPRRFWNDYFRVREACRAAEERCGLRRTGPADRTAGRRPTRAEQEKARRHGRPEAPRVTLRRAVSTAVGAAGEEEFFTRFREAGVLVRARLSILHGHQTWMEEAGISDLLRAERMGHLVPGMRGVYGHVSPAMRADLKGALQECWEASLRERARLSVRSIMPVLDALLAAQREPPTKIGSHSAPRIGHQRATRLAEGNRMRVDW